MTSRSRALQIGGVILGLLAMSALAAPPIFSNNSRTHGNEVFANVCVEIPQFQVQRCADVHAWEHYDVKGTYEFTGIAISYWFHRSNPDGSSRTGQTWMFCQAGVGTIKANPNRVTLEAVLHPDGPECDTWGILEDCDALGICVPRPWGFSDPTVVTGAWIDPINTSKVVVNHTDNFFDSWTETSHKIVSHCNENWGDVMSRGGFSLGFGNRTRDFPFEGLDTQGWTNYWLRSCNDNSKVK
jgi:hypothetical protein